MAREPLRRKEPETKPKIWSSGGQRPPFELRAFGRSTLFLSREGIAPILAWAARTGRRVAENVGNGAGRIPKAKLGRIAPYVPSHLRVAAWIKNLAATLAHASATADPDVKRGNDLVAAVALHLWPTPDLPDRASPAAAEPAAEPPLPDASPDTVPPVILSEPTPAEPDPLASIRTDLQDGPQTGTAPDRPHLPPAPPGAVAEGAIQVLGYLLGWGATVIALPYGAGRSLWLYTAGRDLRSIGQDD